MAIIWAFIMVIAQNFNLGVASEWLFHDGRVGISFNIAIGLFNLLPIPPLDGGQLLHESAAARPVDHTMLGANRARIGFLIILVMIADGHTVFRRWCAVPSVVPAWT